MPASRSARAITFAPRSWPSRPTFAMTTRVLRAIGAAVYGRAADRRRLVACLAERGRRPIRLSRRGRRAPAPSRLWPGRARAATRAGRPLARHRRDRDHALAPRPLGRPRALGLGEPERSRPWTGASRPLAATRRPRTDPGLRR